MKNVVKKRGLDLPLGHSEFQQVLDELDAVLRNAEKEKKEIVGCKRGESAYDGIDFEFRTQREQLIVLCDLFLTIFGEN